MSRAAATSRSAASARLAVQPYTKVWQFNGTTAYGRQATGIDLSGYRKCVLSFWLRPENTGTTVLVEHTDNYNANEGGLIFYQESGLIRAAIRNVALTSNSQWSSAAYGLRRWTHVCAYFDRTMSTATGVKIYFNGVLTGSNTVALGSPLNNEFASAPFNLASRGGASLFTACRIKDVRIAGYTGTWTDADSLALYRDGAYPSHVMLRHNWLGEDAVATSAVDIVGGGTMSLPNTSFVTTTLPPVAARSPAVARTAA